MSYSDDDSYELYGDCELYEGYNNFIDEEPTCNISSHFTYKDDDDFYVSAYDEVVRTRSIHDGFSCRGRPKEPFIYLADYWGLGDGLLKHLSFREYCSLEIQKLFKNPYYRISMERIAHMVDEVCKKVGTRWLPPGAKRDEEDTDAHPQPSTVTERSHEPTNSTMDEEEDTPLKEHEEGINHLVFDIHEVEIDEGELNSLQDIGSE